MKCTRCNREAEDADFKYCRTCRDYQHRHYVENRESILERDRLRYHENIEYERARGRKYAKEHPETAHARHVKWYSEHVEDRRVYHSNYFKNPANKERHAKVCAQWYEANREHTLAKGREWKKANPEKRRVHWHNRMARVKGNGGNLPVNAEDLLFETQDGLCYLCGKALYARFDDPLSIEHKIPVSRGGSNDISNVALAHLSCNVKKGTKTYEEFLETRNR